MPIWLDHIRAATAGGETCVTVMVAAVRGSAPREPGAGMAVTPSRVFGTIGGGNLELTAIGRAREAIAGDQPLSEGGEVRRYVLGTELGQCCGGVAFLHYELVSDRLSAWVDELDDIRDGGRAAVLLSHRTSAGVERCIVTAAGFEPGEPADAALRAAEAAARAALEDSDADRDLLWSPDTREPPVSDAEDFVLMSPVSVGDFQVVIFGAGHVGRALVHVLYPPVDRIVWCDGRAEEFPAVVPSNVRVASGDPFGVIDAMPGGTYFLVMTHSHSLDLALCEAVLQRGDHAYLGLIGSRSKRRRFERHLSAEGLTDADLKRMICPIGVEGIHSKEPAAIAVSVTAQLLRTRECLSHRGRRSGSPV